MDNMMNQGGDISSESETMVEEIDEILADRGG